MRNIISEIKKSLYIPFFCISCLGVVVVCMLSVGYTSVSIKDYTIMELFLFLRRDTMLSDVMLNRYEIWVKGIGTWSTLLLPLLLSMGYLYVNSVEKQSGSMKFLLVREGNFRYCISKTISAMVSGGIIMVVGYVIFGLLIYIRFPSLYEYSANDISYYMELHTGFNEGLFFVNRCVEIFIYGMLVNIFSFWVSIVFVDKYILLCLPLMLKYMWGQIILKIMTGAMNREQYDAVNLYSELKLENILVAGSSSWRTVIFILILYVIGFVANMYMLNKKGDSLGFE